jgi:hypothetical protein
MHFGNRDIIKEAIASSSKGDENQESDAHA